MGTDAGIVSVVVRQSGVKAAAELAFQNHTTGEGATPFPPSSVKPLWKDPYTHTQVCISYGSQDWQVDNQY